MLLLWEMIYFFKKQLPNGPAIPLLGIYPKELKTGTQTDICTPIFIAALFTIAQGLKQPKIH